MEQYAGKTQREIKDILIESMKSEGATHMKNGVNDGRLTDRQWNRKMSKVMDNVLMVGVDKHNNNTTYRTLLLKRRLQEKIKQRQQQQDD